MIIGCSVGDGLLKLLFKLLVELLLNIAFVFGLVGVGITELTGNVIDSGTT